MTNNPKDLKRDNSVPSTHSSAGTCSHGVSLGQHCEQCVRTSKTESNRDKVLRGEVVKVTDDRLREMQEQARRMMGVGDTEYHWHWSAVINELIARRADETSGELTLREVLEELQLADIRHDLQAKILLALPTDKAVSEKPAGQMATLPIDWPMPRRPEEPSPVIADPTRWPMPPPPKTWMPAWLREFHCQCETSGDAAGKCVACQAADLIEKSPSNGSDQ